MSDDPAKWVKAMATCLAEAEQDQLGSPCPVVDHELIASFSGSPDDMCVWFVCRTDEEKQLFADTERSRFVSGLRRKMIAAGFPDSAVATLTTKLTSREEVDAGGGRFYFFR
ncbi:MAG TPA: hypothetical protein VHD32_00010 [Candidatus Didemnitutus sp.]|nr:hypothetical protein [Candidatus Didemnitutus sp.]